MNRQIELEGSSEKRDLMQKELSLETLNNNENKPDDGTQSVEQLPAITIESIVE